MKRRKLSEDVEDIRQLVKDCPEAVEYLPPFQRKIVQALMRHEGNTAARGRERKPLPSP